LIGPLGPEAMPFQGLKPFWQPYSAAGPKPRPSVDGLKTLYTPGVQQKMWDTLSLIQVGRSASAGGDQRLPSRFRRGGALATGVVTAPGQSELRYVVTLGFVRKAWRVSCIVVIMMLRERRSTIG
jgi:hypothetical protein